ncbi:MAG: hypothetical protein KDJ33_18880 [Gammaproteobacteria bacterium]|nr:hypothetical protein [Gammaproteobacteria bacterium]
MGMFAEPVDDTAARVAAFEASLASVLSSRVVSPGFTPAGMRSTDDLQAGVVNVVLAREFDYGRAFGLTAIDAGTEVLLICHLQVDEDESCGRGELSTAVRAAELALLAEIKTFCRTKIDGIEVLLNSVEFSRQLEAPMGWLVATVEMRPPAASTN